MTADTTLRSARRATHLRLLTQPPAEPEPAEKRTAPMTAQELREMRRVAAHLRRCARRLPEHSQLRAELLETAEYYALAVDDAA